MESDPGILQFGGNQSVPNGVNLSEFMKRRMEEVVMLTETIEESPFRGQAFQRLPKHMRRRQMSHYVKRLPRRLQKPYLLSLKDGPSMPTKRPSRKYRRRPGNLLLEYNRRQKNSVWMETHIWHAKRFHMTTKWGYKLPEKPVNKSFKACYRAMSEHCLLIDVSYNNCIELKGPKSKLLSNLEKCTSPDCGLTFGAKMYLSGTREGHVLLFHPNSDLYRAIGNISFMWEPETEEAEESKIWIWTHPLIHNEVVSCFKLLFGFSDVNVQLIEKQGVIIEESKVQKKNEESFIKRDEEIKLNMRNFRLNRTPSYTDKSKSVTMTLFKDTLNRFKLIGPLSQAVVSEAFTVASVRTADSDTGFLSAESKKRKIDIDLTKDIKEVDVKKLKNINRWWEKYYERESCLKNWLHQKNFMKMSECWRPSDMPSGMILGLIIEDPRLKISSKKSKAVLKIKDAKQMPATSVEPGLSQSPIWNAEIREEVSLKKLLTAEINEAKAKKIVPGFEAEDVISDEKQSRIPILLIQNPGRRESQAGKLALGSGWDLIAPAGFGLPIWLSLIFKGAKAGGLRELELLQLECNYLSECLPPDSGAGESENRLNFEYLKTRYFELPPNKRANFTKLGVLNPFYPPWELLIRNWISEVESEKKVSDEKIKFRVLRDFKLLRELNEVVNKLGKKDFIDKSKMLQWGVDYLIPVVIECFAKGNPKYMAMICLPEEKDFKNLAGPGPLEPSQVDENEEMRKTLKKNHLKLLKSLKRKRRKEKAKLKEEIASGSPATLNILRCNSTAPILEANKVKMESLWLPKTERVMNPGSRKIIGFVVKGGFSFSRSRGLGLGYVTLPGLLETLSVCQKNKSEVIVLVRNTNHVQYRFGKLRIGLE